MGTVLKDEIRIQSDRILLRNLQEKDTDFLMSFYDSPLSREKAEQMYIHLAGTDACHLVIEDRETHAYTGMIELRKKEDCAELGYRISPAYRRMHYAQESVGMLVRELIQSRGFRKICALMNKDNAPSIRVLTHNGFEKTEETGDLVRYVYTAENTYVPPPGLEVIYAAGGCFWGTEKAFRMLEGVTDTVTGYANGHTENPSYEYVCRGDTGYRETVRITYDPNITPLETILEAFFLCVDPTVRNRQGNDFGPQYQTGIYYVNDEQKAVIGSFFDQERKKHERFFVETEPLRSFHTAEAYHQRYLDRNPGGYCHITKIELEAVRRLNRKEVRK